MIEGMYRPGQKLPSVRQAAELYGCSTSTIVRAYSELEKRHAIYSVSQSGYYVVGRTREIESNQSDTIDFTSSSPDPSVFPYIDFQHCLNKAIDTYKEQLFTYGELEGLLRLRKTLVSHLANDQIFADEGRIVITSGISEALEILTKMQVPNGHSAILVEQPGYNVYLHHLQIEGIPVHGIVRTTSGIDLNELEERFRNDRIKYFYTMPRLHNPLGTTFASEERKALADLAMKYNVYIVEDDYMADLDDSKGYEPIYAYGASTHVIYLKSFSKIIFPGLRLGAVVLPESLYDPFLALKRYSTSLLSQAALDVYMKNGMYDRHRHTIREQYIDRLQALNAALQRYNVPDLIEFPQVETGVFSHIKLQRTVNVDHLINRLANRKVRVVSGSRYYLSTYLNREKLLRISVSRVRKEQTDAGIRAIVEEARRSR